MATINRTASIASQKQPLPHVSALIQSVESRGASFDARKTLSSQRTTKQRSTPTTPKHDSLDLRSTPNIHLLASLPDFYPTETPSMSTPLRRRKSGNSGVSSPASMAASIAEEPIFELPTPMPMESPNSSVALSFVAELEDTSGLGYELVPPMPVRTQLAPPTDTSILFKTNKFTSQAILKVVDEAIASIEAQNRELHARAEAAEASAYRLHVSNTELRNRVEELSQHQRPRPANPSLSKATQTSPRSSLVQSRRTSAEQSNGTNLLSKSVSLTASQNTISRTPSKNVDVEINSSHSSLTNKEATTPAVRTAQLVHIVNLPPKVSPLASHPTRLVPPPPSEPPHEPTGIPQPKFRRSIRSLKFLQRNHGDNLPGPPPSNTITPSKALRQSSDRPRTADAATPSATSSQLDRHENAPPLPELPIFLSLTTGASILSENNNSESKEATRPRRLTRTVSFEEAKKIAEQMDNQAQNLNVKNPPGEISPSPIDGIVELGLGIKEIEKDGQGDGKPLRSQKSRVRFLLKENSIKDFMRDRDGQKDLTQRKKHTWLKWGKKGDEGLVAV